MKKKVTATPQAEQVWMAARDFDVSTMMAGGESGMKAMAEAQEHFIARVAKMHREIAGFVDRRLKHDRETVHALAECKSPQEFVTVWGKFAETASRQYVEELGTIAGMGVDQAREAVEDAQHEIEETVTPFASGGKNA
ncbi:MAG: phasin family protein [Pseudomonadota bacterium]